MKINCRKAKMCAFCKYWLGKEPDMNYITGECSVRADVGKCSLDETGQYHKTDDLCFRFEKNIIYM